MLATLVLHIDIAICGVGDKRSEHAQIHTVASLFWRCVDTCVCPPLEMESSKEEQSGVVRFLVAEGTGTLEIHCRMCAV